MVLVSPELGRNTHQPLSRFPICNSESNFLSFAPPSETSGENNASAFFSNTNSYQNAALNSSDVFQQNPQSMRQRVMGQENCWNNIFSSNLSNSTPILNTNAGVDQGKRIQQRVLHQLVSPSFSSGDYSDHQHTQNLLTQTNSSPLQPSAAAISLQQQQQNQQNQQQKNPKLYKTELCRSWVDTGRCNYGERCQYAHGDKEKRPIPRHPKYKTESCQSFHAKGYCPYGPRCHFIHNEPEHILAAMVGPPGSNSSSANNLSANATPTPPTPTNNASNPNLMMLRQMNSSSSPATPLHLSGSFSGSQSPAVRMHSNQIPTFFQQQHQPLAATQSWCLGGGAYNSNHNQFNRATSQMDSQNQIGSGKNSQFFSGMQQDQSPDQPKMSRMAPISFSPLQYNSYSALQPTSNQSVPINPNPSSSAGDSSPTSSIPSTVDSGTESPSLGSGSFSPTLETNTNDSVGLCRLSPTSFRSSLLIMGQNNGEEGLSKDLESLSFNNQEHSPSNEIEAETLRRASGSSLGSNGVSSSASVSTPVSSSTGSSNNLNSDAEAWAKQRLPVFERLSNGPF